jgi:ribonuclease Z
MEVGFLGTAGAIAGARRGNTSLAFAARTMLLVDCSGNPAQALAACGLGWESLEHVLLTHRHADHLYALPSLVHQLHLAHRPEGRPPLRVWGPESALDIARQLLEATGLWDRDDLFEIRLQALPPAARELALGDLQVTVFPVTHVDVPTLGLRVAPADRPTAAAVYSADTEPCAAVWQHCRDAALLVHECSSFDRAAVTGHTTLDQLEQLLPDRETLRVRLVHLPPVSHADERRAVARLRARFGNRVLLASDGDVVEV